MPEIEKVSVQKYDGCDELPERACGRQVQGKQHREHELKRGVPELGMLENKIVQAVITPVIIRDPVFFQHAVKQL